MKTGIRALGTVVELGKSQFLQISPSRHQLLTDTSVIPELPGLVLLTFPVDVTFWHLKDSGLILIIKDTDSYCWERWSHVQSFDPNTKVGLKPGTVPQWDTKSPHSRCQVRHLVWEYLSLFQGQQTPFCLCLMQAQSKAPVQPPLHLPQEGRGQGPFHCGVRGVRRGQLLFISSRERHAGHRGPTPSAAADLALFLFYVSLALVQPVPDSPVSSSATLIPRCSGQKCWESSPGIANWGTALCLTPTEKL